MSHYSSYLPAAVWRLPFQNKLGKWRWLQFILVKGKLLYHHWFTVHTRESHNGMCRTRWLGVGDVSRRLTALKLIKSIKWFLCSPESEYSGLARTTQGSASAQWEPPSLGLVAHRWVYGSCAMAAGWNLALHDLTPQSCLWKQKCY